MKETLTQFSNRTVTLVTVCSVVLFLLTAGASLYVAQLRAGVNTQLRGLDERREVLNRDENNLRAEIGVISGGSNMEARAKRMGFVQVTPSAFITATAGNR